MKLDPKAAVSVRSAITIDAPLETIWGAQTDIDRWSEWNPDIDRARLEGPLQAGSFFQCTSNGASVRSKLEDVSPMRELVWSGKSLGVRALQIWRFEPAGKATWVVSEASFDGWWARLRRGTAKRTLERSLQSWLAALKRRAEAEASNELA